MKKILLLSAFILILGIGAAVVALRTPATLGQPFRVAAATPLAEILTNPASHVVSDLRTEGRIVRQCPSSGCWFYLENGSGKQLRVELGHLGMTFPQHIGGLAEVEGRLVQSGQDLELVGNGVRFK